MTSIGVGVTVSIGSINCTIERALAGTSINIADDQRQH